MLSQRCYTKTCERHGQRIRQEVTVYLLLGFIPVLYRSVELWRKAALVTDEDRAAVFALDSFQCVYCGDQTRRLLSIDHRLPQRDGGTSERGNLLTACRACNSSKNARTPEEANMPLVYGRYVPLMRPEPIVCDDSIDVLLLSKDTPVITPPPPLVSLPIVAVDMVSVDDQRAIIEAAQRLSSHRAVCLELYNNTGGPNYERIKLVCDAAGIL